MIPSRVAITILFSIMVLCAGCSDSGSSMSSDSGNAGSMARFMVQGDYLYTLNPHNMTVYDIKNKYVPKRIETVNSNERLETIFPYKNFLYVGTQGGMLIYDITNPENPRLIGSQSHIVSCDPVVVANDIAYITLRDGTQCRSGDNQLEVIDVSNPLEPKQLSIFRLNKPFGLGIDGSRLYVLDKEAGMFVFDVSNPRKIQVLDQIQSISGYDCIPYNKKLFVSAEDGIYIFDTSSAILKKLGEILF